MMHGIPGDGWRSLGLNYVRNAVGITGEERGMASKLFVGLVTVDVYSCVDCYPQRNEKKRAKRQSIFAGGPAANAAVACRALGSESSLISVFGGHALASMAKEDLGAHGVSCHDMDPNYQGLPVISAVIVEESSGDRGVVYSSPENLAWRLSPETLCLPEDASVLLVDGYHLEAAILLARSARSRGCAVVLDGGSWKAGLESLLPHVDYAICSADFRPPGVAPDELFPYLRSFGVGKLAVSRGGQPLLADDGSGKQELAVEEVESCDTLGAGDILHGAFCHFLDHCGFVESLVQAMRVASFSCRFHGTREWIRYLEQELGSRERG